MQNFSKCNYAIPYGRLYHNKKMLTEMRIEDHELITQMRDKDSIDAFDALFCRYYPSAVSLAGAITGDAEYAKDLAQDIFLKLWMNRAQLDPSKSVRSLILTSVHNASINYLKSRRTAMLSVVGDISEPQSDATREEILLTDRNTELDRLVQEMPPMRRRVFEMSRREGKDRESIARELNISLRTVDKHLELALKSLRKNLS